MAMEEELKSIYSTRDEKMVSEKDERFTVRTARFLNPCAKTLNQAFPIPKDTTLLADIFSHDLQEWPSKVLFKGWKLPQKKWKDWVLQLSPKYGPIWKKSGIHEAIMASVYEIRPNPELVFGLSEFWCPDTNSFVFPWGEATITLEDILIIGGYPVLGKPVTSPTKELEKIVQEMEKQRIKFSRSASHKAAHGGWLNQYMGSNGDFEHLAFLSLWLSRYVLTSLPEKVIGKHVFPIAARLSEGTPMALAPAVLASLYKDLSLLRKQAITCSESTTVTAPFQLLQLWAFERFPHLGPKSPNALERLGEPRAARWHKLNSKASNLPIVRSALSLEENFRWRPYCTNLKNWRSPCHYPQSEQVFLDFSGLGRELRSFARCLQGCKLVGMGFKELYLPHRVGRQFGFDQDIPAVYEFGYSNLGQVKFFVPSRSFEPCASERYLKWWKRSMVARKGNENSLEQKIFLKYSRTSLVEGHGHVVRKNVSSLKTNSRALNKFKVKGDDDASSVSSRSPYKSNTMEIRDLIEDYEDNPTSRSLVCAHVANTASIGHKMPSLVEGKSSPVVPSKHIFRCQTGQISASTATSQKFHPYVGTKPSLQNRFFSAISASSVNYRKRDYSAISGTIVQPKLTQSVLSVSKIGKEAGRKDVHLLSDTNSATGKVKRKVSDPLADSLDHLDFVILRERIKLKGSRISGEDGDKKKQGS